MKRILITALVLALTIPGMVKAQTTDGGTIAVDIGELLYVNITTGDNQTLSPTLTDFDNTFVDATTALTIESGANAPYDLFIRGNAVTWTYDPDGTSNSDPSKPLADLLFLPPGGSYTAMTTSNQVVENFAAPGENNSSVDLRVALDYADDVQGIYTMNYTVEVIAP